MSHAPTPCRHSNPGLSLSKHRWHAWSRPSTSSGRGRRAPAGVEPRSALLADLGESLARGKRLRIELELDDGGLGARERLAEGGGEIGGGLDGVAVRAEAPGKGRKVRIDEGGADDAARILALLVGADGAVHAVVGDNDDDG